MSHQTPTNFCTIYKPDIFSQYFIRLEKLFKFINEKSKFRSWLVFLKNSLAIATCSQYLQIPVSYVRAYMHEHTQTKVKFL